MTFSNGMTEKTEAPQAPTKRASKDKIFSEAAKLFAQKGYHGTSVRDIAKSAGVNVALINYHYTSKENLFLQVVKYGIDELNNKVSVLRGLSVEKILRSFYSLAIDLNGSAYHLSVIFSSITGGFDKPETISESVYKKPTVLELTLAEAIEREYGVRKDSSEVKKVSSHIMKMGVSMAQIRFGLQEQIDSCHMKAYYREEPEICLAMLLDVANRLCASLRPAKIAV